MAAIGVLATKSPVKTNNNAYSIAKRDAILTGDNGGVRFLFDLGFPYCYPGGSDPYNRPAAADPANNAVVVDISGNANGRIAVGSAIAYAGGGLNFAGTTVAANANFVEAPASVAADLYASQVAPGGNQYYLFFGYFLLPAEADWITENNTVVGLMQLGTYNAQPDLASFLMAQQQIGGHPTLRWAHQNGVNVASLSAFNPPSFGVLAQLALYRTAAGAYARVKTAAGTAGAGPTVDAGTPSDYSAQKFQWGMNAFWNAGSASHANARKFRVFRGGVENLVRSGRDPVAVLDADWARVVARNAFV